MRNVLVGLKPATPTVSRSEGIVVLYKKGWIRSLIGGAPIDSSRCHIASFLYL